MKDAITLIVSALEFYVNFILTLIIFRFSVRSYLNHTIFGSVLLSQLSFFLYNYSVTNSMAPVIQLIIIILFLWLMFRVQIFYACAMGIFGFLIYILIQSGIVALMSLGFTLEQINTDYAITKIMQLLTIVVSLLVGFLLHRKRIGFSFIPDNDRQKINWVKQNILLLISIIATLVIFPVIHYFVVSGTSLYFYIASVAVALIVGVFLYFTIRKEYGK